MNEGLRGGNPYDFRSAVRHRALLAGRNDELAKIDGFLREAASGRPAHISLFGGEGIGKSSLLNAAADLASARGFLAVRLALTESIVQTELDFYKAVYESALQALLDEGRLAEDDPTMRAWVVQTCTGDLPQGTEREPLELALLIAARIRGLMPSAVPTALVKRDLGRMLSLGKEKLHGLVLCLDSAELLSDNRDLGPSLLQLADATALLTIVTAAEHGGSLQSTAPRAWAQIEIGPFATFGDVLDAIARPLHHAHDVLGTDPLFAAAVVDIAMLTTRTPYEINLVCHFIWDAIQQGEQENFELSPTVIQQVASELEQKGRHQASLEIQTFSRLPPNIYELLVDFAPYEALTVRQLALMRLMFEDYGATRLDAAEATVRESLKQLEDQGVVRIERDRFEVKGGRDARLYLKYAAHRHTGQKLRYDDRYPDAVTEQVATHVGRAFAEESYEAARIFHRGRPQELGGRVVGKWLDSMGEAAATRNIVALSNEIGAWLSPEEVLRHGDLNFVLTGLQLQVDLHNIEHIQLVANTQHRSLEDIRAVVRQWVADHEELLRKYDARVEKWRCETIPADVLRVAVAYEHVFYACNTSYSIYRRGALEAADSLLASALQTSNKLVGSEPADPLLREQIASAMLRRGFMAATRSEWEVALQHLNQSRTMRSAEDWVLTYDSAYVHASKGDLHLAIKLVSSAVDAYQDDEQDRALLHAYFPRPIKWEPPNEQWNVVELLGNWIKRFLDLQLLVLRSIESEDYRQELRSTLEEVSGSAPAAILRLAGWATLSLLEDPEAAAEFFRRAVLATPYDEAQDPSLEAEYAKSVANGDPDPQTDPLS